MSTIDPLQALQHEPWDDIDAAAAELALAPRGEASIVPGSSIAGRSLAAVVAIMTFLAALTTGAAMLVVSTANDWQSEVGREITIQVRPAAGRDIEADVSKAVTAARAAPGVAEVRAYSKEESEKLVEPWLGSGLHLDDLPIPRLIVVKLTPGTVPNFVALRQTLGEPGADRKPRRSPRLDRAHAHHGGHRGGGRARGARVGRRGDHTLGHVRHPRRHGDQPADRRGAALHRRHRQLRRPPVPAPLPLLGLKGGAIGGAAAMLLFGCAEAARAWLAGTPSGDEAAALFGSLSIGVTGYLAIAVQILVMAVVTALVSRYTVNRTLETID